MSQCLVRLLVLCGDLLGLGLVGMWLGLWLGVLWAVSMMCMCAHIHECVRVCMCALIMQV